MKKKEIDFNRPVWQLTVEEYINLHTEMLKEKKKEFVYGYNGLARLLGCSRSKAASVIKSGDIEEATFQTGKILIFDKEKVLELLKKA